MSEPVSVVLVGIGGYGELYLSALVDEAARGRCRLAAAVDPSPERSPRLPELRTQGVPIYSSMDELPPATGSAELVVISSPIHQHSIQTCQALARGSYVLCEKPAAPTVQEVDEMIAARDRAGRWVAIGYQWSFSRPIRQLKQDIQAGMFGQPRQMKSLCLWPRDASYYGRNNWAGRLRDDQGCWVLDSPANNAMAHDLHNMLFVLGDRPDRSAIPAEVTAETYRANAIESFDTMAVRVRTVSGAEILFFGSHAVRENLDPIFAFDFDDAVVTFAGGQSPIVARFRSGARKEYASPMSDPQSAKFSICLDAILTGTEIPCVLETARPHTVCVNGIHESMPEATAFSAEMVRHTGEAAKRLTYVEEVPSVLRECYEQARLPSEQSVSWAHCGRAVDVRDYAWYPGGRRAVGR